ncbi:MAG TPA: D-glycero-beta-D-manno-heptose-7-phosphate kinase [Candidatus Eisenbacteria bacterium]|nr:D-glycero-beta-D-manno-heptose-7-phosphate kinase [Candidatus Eisenbacteria bacterium]
MKSLNYARFKGIVSGFSKAKVLVVGDLILDEFIWGKVTRISPEAPVPVVWVDSENFMPGGASNVANNIRALGGEVYLAGAVGADQRGEILNSLLRKNGVHCDGVFPDEARPTTQKTRIIAHHQQVVRIDREKLRPIGDKVLKELIAYCGKLIPHVDAIIVEDYGKGVIVPRLVKEIVKMGKRHGKIITVDPKEEHFSYYRGVTTITPNHHEAGSAAGISITDEASLRKAGAKLMAKLQCESVLITRGENGMCLFRRGHEPVMIPTVAQEVFDVSGAGDTVISAYTLARASHASPVEAAVLSNFAAGIVVGKLGTASTSAEELLSRLHKEISA